MYVYPKFRFPGRIQTFVPETVVSSYFVLKYQLLRSKFSSLVSYIKGRPKKKISTGVQNMKNININVYVRLINKFRN